MARPKKKRRTIRTPSQKGKSRQDWTVKFLQVIARQGNITKACKMVGIGRRTFYDRRDTDLSFRVQLQEAFETATDVLDAEARKRALRDSDKLLLFLLRAHRPEIYGARIDLEHRGKVNLQIEDMADDELLRIVQAGGSQGVDAPPPGPEAVA